MSEERKLGRVRLSMKLLLDALQFPEGTRCVNANVDVNVMGEMELVLFLNHHELDEVAEGHVIPELTPKWKMVSHSEFDCW